MKLFRHLFGISAEKRCAYDLYGKAVARARMPVFYQRLGVPDTLDGRFDMIVIHVCLLLRRLRAVAGSDELQSCLQEALFADMDRALREMGVGDLSVGKHIRRMAEAFMGRVNAYDAALDAKPGQGGDDALVQAIRRNVFRGDDDTDEANLQQLARDMRAQSDWLDTMPDSNILAGTVDFVPCDYDEMEPTDGQRI